MDESEFGMFVCNPTFAYSLKAEFLFSSGYFLTSIIISDEYNFRIQKASDIFRYLTE